MVEYYLAIKKNEIMPFTATRMDGPRDYHTERSKSDEKEKYHMTSLICGIYKEMIQMNLLIKHKDSQRTNLQLPEGRMGERDS